MAVSKKEPAVTAPQRRKRRTLKRKSAKKDILHSHVDSEHMTQMPVMTLSDKFSAICRQAVTTDLNSSHPNTSSGVNHENNNNEVPMVTPTDDGDDMREGNAMEKSPEHGTAIETETEIEIEKENKEEVIDGEEREKEIELEIEKDEDESESCEDESEWIDRIA
eukprot:CAMPEP_0182426594 /NCGR_PEP_ID=MMETSP1167-20130531/13111_1 /TAXON_ID=2988 /ORGANISM="Mallomonas Sp, Strain CCMP3275" /LENGTH=163 /DNA_ID=CAMNT_0024608155 /DNA_START=293 /DNA_END=781 /DNA_ORIENTATION=+